MKWSYLIIGVLSCSLLWAVVEVRRVDRTYSHLIESSSRELQLIQRLTANSNRRHILLYHAGHATQLEERRDALQKMATLSKLNTQIFDSLIQLTETNPNQGKLIQQAIESRKKYNAAIAQYVAIINESKSPVTDFPRDENLNELFEDYQHRINAMYLSKNENVLSSSAELTGETSRRSFWILAFSALPLVLITVIIVASIWLIRSVLAPFSRDPR